MPSTTLSSISSFFTFSLRLITLLIFLPTTTYSEGNEWFSECFAPFSCGDKGNLMFPFWTDDSPEICRQEGFKVSGCKGGNDQPPIISIDSYEFRMIYLNIAASTITIARNDLWENICPAPPVNVTLPLAYYPFLRYSPTNRNLTFFYNCNRGIASPPSNLPEISCNPRGDMYYSFVADNSLEGDEYEHFREACATHIQVEVNQSGFSEFRDKLRVDGSKWRLGFDVVYNHTEAFCTKCKSVGGQCNNLTSPAQYPICIKGKNGLNLGVKLGIGFGAAIGGVLISSIGFYIWQRRRQEKVVYRSSYASGKSSSARSFMTDPENGDSIAGVHLFTYEELLKATKNFDSERELGDGGFGTVYYGELEDGRAVAVKRLYENNYKRVEQFMNEVDMLTRLRHKNLVALYGCTSRHSRELLLVYEYIANGTVADHLHGQRAKPGALPWSTRLEIAIETADALRYLHASDTIHRDVKTNNILLDSNFTVKVADFGLSRLFPTDVTHVSTAPQGTPGYVDPEYHQCYQLTDKSDVFSFGVVLIELISSKPAVDITRHRHEINLSNMAINKIQNRALHELVDPSLGFESDYKVRKMITGVAEVAFQCLQGEKDMRPTMAEVLDALMGIHNEDYSKAKAEVVDMSSAADDVGLLKSGPPPHSPDSVMIKWVSDSSVTPSVSN